VAVRDLHFSFSNPNHKSLFGLVLLHLIAWLLHFKRNVLLCIQLKISNQVQSQFVCILVCCTFSLHVKWMFSDSVFFAIGVYVLMHYAQYTNQPVASPSLFLLKTKTKVSALRFLYTLFRFFFYTASFIIVAFLKLHKILLFKIPFTQFLSVHVPFIMTSLHITSPLSPQAKRLKSNPLTKVHTTKKFFFL